jgi:hypothetical protein
MSTATNQPTQQQVNDTASRIRQAAQPQRDAGSTPARNPDQTQQANDDQTRRNQEAAVARQRETQQTRQQQARDAARRQRETVRARQEEVRHGDMVVVDLERIPESMHTAAMRDRLQQLHQAGAHTMVGRVQSIEDGPTGRLAVVEDVSGISVQRVPLQAAVRADLYDGVDEESE